HGYRCTACQVCNNTSLVTNTLEHIANAQLSCAYGNDIALACGYQGNPHPTVGQHFEAMAIKHMKALDQLTLVGVKETPVSQHTVHIKNHEFYGGCSLNHGFRNFCQNQGFGRM